MSDQHRADVHFPDLRFVPTDAIVPHEQHDEQRLAPLVRLIREESVLRNPPVVTPLHPGPGTDRYVVLDGANRSTAARAAGFPHVVVQVVPYDPTAVRLTTWNHALSRMPHGEIDALVRQVPGLRCTGVTDPVHARAALARREAVALVQYDDAIVIALVGGRDLHARNLQLNQLVQAYSANGRFHRVATDSLEQARERHHDTTALVVFPHYEPAEVLELAALGDRLPAGITRHLVLWRALRVNVPTAMMQDPARTIEEKNRWLQEWLRDKIAHRRVRYYEEPTVLFDE
jgi:hypothetical protein